LTGGFCIYWRAGGNPNGVGTKLSGVMTKSSDVETKLSVVMTKSSGLGIKLSGVMTKLSGMGTKLSGLMTKPSGVGTKLSGVMNKSTGVGTKLRQGEKRFSSLWEKVKPKLPLAGQAGAGKEAGAGHPDSF